MPQFINIFDEDLSNIFFFGGSDISTTGHFI